jgi:hypothetical protein
MKLSLAANTLALMPLLNSVSPTAADHHEGEEGCTHGMLFVSSTEDATIRAFDLSNGLEDLAPKASITVPSVGPELNLSKDSSGKVVSVVYRGSEANLYQVRIIDRVCFVAEWLLLLSPVFNHCLFISFPTLTISLALLITGWRRPLDRLGSLCLYRIRWTHAH